jgi:hypothetical protein
MSFRPFDFSEALRHLKLGAAVTRKGWNGKGMFLVQVPGSRIVVAEGRPLAEHLPVGTQVDYQSHIDMFTAQGTMVPWLCSQTDMVAQDWDFHHVVPFHFSHWRNQESKQHTQVSGIAFRFTPVDYFAEHGCLADTWALEAQRYLSHRWERIMDSTYIYQGGYIQLALAELEELGWVPNEAFDRFVNRGLQ